MRRRRAENYAKPIGPDAGGSRLLSSRLGHNHVPFARPAELSTESNAASPATLLEQPESQSLGIPVGKACRQHPRVEPENLS
jgi:hypothetical protein